jgi:hypothetical protein
VRIGAAIAVTGAADVLVDKAAAVPNTTGPQKTLAILVNFQNAPTQPLFDRDGPEPDVRHDQRIRSRGELPANDRDRRRRRLVHHRSRAPVATTWGS